MFDTNRQRTTQVIECMVRVKDGSLAPRGKGTLTVTVMPDGEVMLSLTLPSANGVPKPFDLRTIERLELVKTRIGWYQGNQWIKPAVAIVSAVVVPIIMLPILFPVPATSDPVDLALIGLVGMAFYAGLTAGFSVPALMYAGSKLPRIVRFVAVTHDGEYCVAEMPEAAFQFLQGVRTAMNLHIRTDTPVVSTPEVSETALALA